MRGALARRMEARPTGVALVTALIWGLWWVPIRWVEALGASGAWAGVAMVAGAAALMLPVWLVHRVPGGLSARGMAGACCMGTAVMTYSAALAEGEVVRVVLIFYLAPVWSKIIERVFMGMAWHRASWVALALSFAGILCLTGGTPEAVVRPGEGLALVSGMAWAVGSALVFGSGDGDVRGLTFVTCVAGAAMAALLALATEGAPGPMPGLALAGGIGSGMLYVAPLIYLSIWSAGRVAPAILSFLLTAEIASGVISSALFAGEPFGWAHALGTVLVGAGALSEVLVRRRAE